MHMLSDASLSTDTFADEKSELSNITWIMDYCHGHFALVQSLVDREDKMTLCSPFLPFTNGDGGLKTLNGPKPCFHCVWPSFCCVQSC
ncbi:hypothetical protein Sjap_004669 [Stephania japonica]|uniref:Uncharacterized protein n=1 Tax=Stephania japonica TaxID=461633 RepID=A0AAP0K2M5_9MAGN